jgi:hypothetical protein
MWLVASVVTPGLQMRLTEVLCAPCCVSSAGWLKPKLVC